MQIKRLAELKDALTKGSKVELQTKYFVLLPEQKAYETFHPIGGAALFTERVHPKLYSKYMILLLMALPLFRK